MGSSCRRIVCLLNLITSISCISEYGESHVEADQQRLDDPRRRMGAAGAPGAWIPADQNLIRTPLYGIQDCPCMYPEKVCDKVGWYAQLVNHIPNSDGSKTWNVMCATPEVTQRQHYAWLEAGRDKSHLSQNRFSLRRWLMAWNRTSNTYQPTSPRFPKFQHPE